MRARRGSLLWCVLTGWVSAQDAAKPIRIEGGGGVWDFGGGAELEVRGRLFHGADVATTATVRWPARLEGSDLELPRSCVIQVASDSFGNRQPWTIVWDPARSVLWVATGALGRPQGRWSLESLRRVDLSDPATVHTAHVHGAWPRGWVPDAIADALDESALLPGEADVDRPKVRPESTTELQPLWLHCRVRVVDAAGAPVVGERVRFSASPRSSGADPLQVGRRGGEAHGGVRILPLNLGLPSIHGVSDADGYVHGVAPVDPMGEREGIVVRAARLGVERGRRVEPSRIECDAADVKARIAALMPAAAISKQVIGFDGKPCAGARVFVCQLGAWSRAPVPADEEGAIGGRVAEGQAPIWLVVVGAETYRIEQGDLPMAKGVTVRLGEPGSGRASISR